MLEAKNRNGMLLTRYSRPSLLVHSFQYDSKRFGGFIPVILLKDLEKRGTKGEVVKVKRGFARNFLIPRGIAGLSSFWRCAAYFSFYFDV